VRILAYTPGAAKEDEVTKFTALTSPKLLGEAGKTFYLRRMSHSPEGSEPNLEEAAQETQNGNTQNPLNDPERPVNLEIWFDNDKVVDGSKKLPFKDDNGETPLREPLENQIVRFHIERTDKAQGRLAILLLVNGVNSVFEEKERAPAEYTKWILSDKPGEKMVDVRGFFVKNDTGYEMIPFKVFSDAESKDQENFYGAKAGQVLFEVYRERGEGNGVVADSAIRGISRGTLPPANKAIEELGQLKNLLKNPPKTVSRGMIGRSDERRKAELEEVPFKCDPEPIMSVAFRYYPRQR